MYAYFLKLISPYQKNHIRALENASVEETEGCVGVRADKYLPFPRITTRSVNNFCRDLLMGLLCRRHIHATLFYVLLLQTVSVLAKNI